jgi:hypothetical protein
VSITATVTSQPITANVSGGSISANVGSSLVTASASGGIGPQGASGAAGGLLEQLQDVLMASVADGDVLRYSSSKWRNFPETNMTFDAGNF